ncbi:uncharacterized protein LOC129206874 isoform X2 [Grus americana]|uniref:uncharacterized protein LOC129206874 isoform X2 n=1 Tax=Grus americana TaxID=9117 RepID=UPI002407792C|nr:uncharacterized protein LOC129206874 isoform X2 [Grus americana]
MCLATTFKGFLVCLFFEPDLMFFAQANETKALNTLKVTLNVFISCCQATPRQAICHPGNYILLADATYLHSLSGQEIPGIH